MTWAGFFEHESNKPYFRELQNKLEAERQNYEVYPLEDDVFALFNMLQPEDVKVVILGQDPYPGYDVIQGKEVPHAMGLSFSVQTGVKTPKSLVNIFKELEADLGIKRSDSNLSDWAEQGVFLLNTSSTVRKGQPMSHRHLMWDEFTKNTLKYLLSINEDLIFILWGKAAQDNIRDLDIKYKIESSHPSPLSAYRSFFGSKPFSRTNDLLKEIDKAEIKWG